MPKFCAQRHRESQEDRTPGQAAITSAPRWNFHLKLVGGTYFEGVEKKRMNVQRDVTGTFNLKVKR